MKLEQLFTQFIASQGITHELVKSGDWHDGAKWRVTDGKQVEICEYGDLQPVAFRMALSVFVQREIQAYGNKQDSINVKPTFKNVVKGQFTMRADNPFGFDENTFD